MTVFIVASLKSGSMSVLEAYSRNAAISLSLNSQLIVEYSGLILTSVFVINKFKLLLIFLKSSLKLVLPLTTVENKTWVKPARSGGSLFEPYFKAIDNPSKLVSSS